MIYLLCSTVPLLRANGVEVRHYLGRCRDDRLMDRIGEHNRGRNSAAVVKEYRRRGGVLRIAALWPGGDAEDERALKEYAHFAEKCPYCTPEKEREHGWTGMVRVYRRPHRSTQQSTKLPATTSATATLCPENGPTGACSPQAAPEKCTTSDVPTASARETIGGTTSTATAQPA